MERSEAVALRLRLELGLSWFNEKGEERSTPPAKARPPRDLHLLPSVDDLMRRFDGVSPASGRGVPAVEMRTLAENRRRLEEQQARQAVQEKAERELATASMLARIEARATFRKSLPCYHLDPMANAKGSDLEALGACEKVKGYRTCEWARDKTTCPRNRVDAGYEVVAERLRAAGVPLKYASRIREAMPGHRVQGARVDPVPLQPRPALLVLEAWLAGGGVTVPPFAPFDRRWPLLVLAGATGGEGKSLTAAWLLAVRDGLWVTSTELVSIPESTYDRDVYLRPEVLVIEEATTEPLTEWRRSRWYDVVASRIADDKRTLVTMNMADKEKFIERYDERLRRRLDESGRFIILAPWVA